MSVPLGYHLTFHPYGTWLPGDDRGWSARPGEPALLAPSRPLAAQAREVAREPPLYFNEEQRGVIADTTLEVCRCRQWTIHALAVHPDHIHVVVTTSGTPERAMNTLKSWSTRRLREAGLVAQTAKVWARHGSTRYLYDKRRAVVAIEYVVRQGGMRFPVEHE